MMLYFGSDAPRWHGVSDSFFYMPRKLESSASAARSLRRILYTTAQSWIYDEEHVNARSASWTTTLYIVDGVVVVLLLACAFMIFRKSRKMAK